MVTMKESEVLVTKTDGKLEFTDFYDFSSVVILDDTGNVASVWVNGKAIGKIYDSDIDRVRDKRKEIVFDRPLPQWLNGTIRLGKTVSLRSSFRF